MRNIESRRRNKTSRLPEQMGARSQEVSPVGAWVQPATGLSLDASEMALQEEQRLLQMQAQKTAELIKFQGEVKSRVQAMNKLKRQQWLEKSSKALLKEQNIIGQSLTSVDKPSTCKRDCCILRSMSDLSIQKGLKTCDGTTTSKHFQEQMKQVNQLHCHARSSLATKKEDFDQDSVLKNYAEDTRSDFVSLSAEAVGLAENDGNIQTAIPCTKNILPDAKNKKDQRWSDQQRATCRRFFMDIERERVKRNIRQKEHLEKMAILKRTKEVERQDLEKVQVTVAFSDSTESSSSFSLEDGEVVSLSELELPQFNVNKPDRWKERLKQTDRYLNLMKRSFKDKMEKQNIEPVQLCLCGSSLWDTNPLTCANNCTFYQNPVGFSKALQSLLSSFVGS